MDENALIAAAQSGELPAFNQLVMHYQGLAYNVAYRIMGDPDAAADTTQDAFIKAYKALGGYRGGSFKAWLLRIVTNTCYDALRARKRRQADSLDDLAVEPEHAWQLANGHAGPEELALRSELGNVIQAGIAQLPEDQRTVLVLTDVQGMSYQEVAEIMGSSLGTVKSRLSRGRAKLRDYLLQQQELLPSRYRLGNAGQQAEAMS
jgi:RNA polymerase sigma-70 factor (ECF subfamily)